MKVSADKITSDNIYILSALVQLWNNDKKIRLHSQTIVIASLLESQFGIPEDSYDTGKEVAPIIIKARLELWSGFHQALDEYEAFDTVLRCDCDSKDRAKEALARMNQFLWEIRATVPEVKSKR